jgi:hypothetical protein
MDELCENNDPAYTSSRPAWWSIIALSRRRIGGYLPRNNGVYDLPSLPLFEADLDELLFE